AAELEPLAKVNVESLAEFGFFTRLTTEAGEAEFTPPTEYFLQFHGGRLTLFYTLPLKEPVAPGARAQLQVFDPEYFVAFTFIDKPPLALVDAPEGCSVTHRRPPPP